MALFLPGILLEPACECFGVSRHGKIPAPRPPCSPIQLSTQERKITDGSAGFSEGAPLQRRHPRNCNSPGTPNGSSWKNGSKGSFRAENPGEERSWNSALHGRGREQWSSGNHQPCPAHPAAAAAESPRKTPRKNSRGKIPRKKSRQRNPEEEIPKKKFQGKIMRGKKPEEKKNPEEKS